MEGENSDKKSDEETETIMVGKGTSQKSGKKIKMWQKVTIATIVLIVAVFVILLMIYRDTQYGKAQFFVSAREIQSITDELIDTDLSINVNENVYFFVSRKGMNLEVNNLTLEIEHFKDNSFKEYKKITYEVDKNFPNLRGYIYGVYFNRAGRYRIKASLDGEVFSKKEFKVE
jgi:hypothetical protein